MEYQIVIRNYGEEMIGKEEGRRNTQYKQGEGTAGVGTGGGAKSEVKLGGQYRLQISTNL